MDIKQRRKDGKVDNVILNENRNKEIKQYQLDSVPHPFQNKEQFNYLNNQPLGREWHGITHHDRAIKPMIKTRAGEIIAPIQKK
jgi:U3 small nucleolar RNA-associated protein 14